MLDYYGENPFSRVPNTSQKTVEAIKNNLGQYLNIPSAVPYIVKKTALTASNNESTRKKSSAGPKPNMPVIKKMKVIKEVKEVKEIKRPSMPATQKNRTVLQSKAIELSKSLLQTDSNLKKYEEREQKRREEFAARIKERRMNSKLLPPLDKSLDKMNAQYTAYPKSRIHIKSIDFLKSRRIGKSQKKNDGIRMNVKDTRFES